MKGRVILLDAPSSQPARAALVIDGRLEDLLVDPGCETAAPDPGAIFWAKVDRLMPAMGGAFLKLDAKYQGFVRETKGLKAGAGVLVQVTGLAEPGKAAPVTRRVLYKGRRMIHTPHAPGINVSRKIKDPDERARLTDVLTAWAPDDTMREAAASLCRGFHESGGTILRSAAAGAGKHDLHQELSWLLAQRAEREELCRSAPSGQISAATTCLDTALREWTIGAEFTIWLAGGTIRYARAKLDRLASAQIEAALREYEGEDLFGAFGIDQEIQSLAGPETKLPSGGSIVVEATRALVAVDVNASDTSPMTANIEAARELPRQLRLRGLGGQIAVDFAPLKKMHRKSVEEALKSALRRDPVETQIAGWTPLGHLELTRKRERRPLAEVLDTL